MTALEIGVAPGRVDEVRADLAIVGIFADERPLRGASGQADWRLCGALSRLIRAGRLRGAPGEAALLPGGGGIRSGQVLVLGLGERDSFDEARCASLMREATDRALGLRARSFALALPGPAASASRPDERAVRLLAVLGEALEASADADAAFEISWVVAPEERPAASEGLRRALVGRGGGTVRMRSAAGPAASASPVAASRRSPPADPAQRVK